MLKIIPPKGQKFHQSTIGSFLDLLKVYQNFELSSEKKKKATFLIAEDDKRGVYGGAVLCPQEVHVSTDHVWNDFHEETLRRSFATFQPTLQEFWMARICLYLVDDSSLSFEEGSEFCKRFSTEIYKTMIECGREKNIKFLAFTLSSHNPFANRPFHGSWPDCVEIIYSAPVKRLCHGVLSLNGAKFITRGKRKAALDHSPENRNKQAANSKERTA